MENILQRKALWIPVTLITALVIWSWASSVIYYFLAGYAGTPPPWASWYALLHPVSDKTSGQLVLAFGLPVLGGIFAGGGIHELLKGKNPGLPKASWATWHDIKKSDLAGNHGVMLGKYKGKFIMSDKPTHIMVLAPTRSGKGVGLVIPNLLNYNGSIVCLDIKHENFDHTAAFRSTVSDVYKWSPMAEDGQTHRYNPLDLISDHKYQRISDLQIFATTLIPEPAHGETVWAEEAQALFIGLALYIIETEENPTMGKIKRLMGAEGELGDICRHILDTHDDLPTSVILSLRNFINKAVKERSGVKTTINKALKLWDNPIIDSATSASDFDVMTLRKKRQTIYISVSIEELQTLAPLLRLFFEQIIKKMEKKIPDKKTEPHQVLMLLDEFHLLGNMQVMAESFSLIAGFNVRLMIISQSFNWLDRVYDKNTRNGILSCCAHQVYFATNDMDCADFVSRRCGQKTVPVESVSSKNGWGHQAKTKNISYRTIPLISPHEVAELDGKKEIILVEKSKSIMADKIFYRNERLLEERAHMKNVPKIPKIQILEGEIIDFDLGKKEPDIDPNQTDMLTNGLLGKSTDLSQKTPKKKKGKKGSEP